MTTSETSSSALSITLFGSMQTLVQGRPMPKMRSRKGMWLLALLTLRHDRPVEREWLAGTLWPDVEQSQAFDNLRPILSELRRGLSTQSARLQAPGRHTLLLDLTGADVDILTFDAAIANDRLEELEQAVVLYRGPLLEGCMEEWVFQERVQREQDCIRALLKLADSALVAGDTEKAVSYYQRAVNLDPWRDTARRGMMEALTKKGNRNAALQVYREFVELLRDDPTATPDEETTALYIRLRAETRQTRSSHVVVAERATGASVAGYLPHPLTDLVGRGDECVEVAARLRRSRLVTLTGMGGIGKTRLAIEVAREVAGEYSDGAWLVGLDTLSEGKQIVGRIATVLGLREEPGRRLLDSVTDHLRGKRLLLVLDNCEHLLESSAQVAGHLLRECERVRILATSREALGITGETAWAVPSLPIPDPAHLPMGGAALLQALMSYESVQLFEERAQAAYKNFTLTATNARTVAQVCHQLEGIPLSIELAAARVKAMPLEQIAARLHHHIGLLTGGSRTAQSRQQTLRSTLDWSYMLLSEPERTLLRRLSVFAGGWTLEAAEGVCAGEGIEAGQVLDLLTSLVDKSLVVFEERVGADGRYRMLEMVRQYAEEQQRASGETERARARHRDWYVAVTAEAEPELDGKEQGVWLTRLESEHENLRAALEWCLVDKNGAELGLRLAGAMWRFWEVRGHYDEGRAYLGRALDRAEAGGRTKARATALNAAGVLAYTQGDYATARSLHEESLEISRELGDKQGMAWPLDHLGLAASHRGDYPAARALHEESLAIWRELGYRQGIAWTLHLLASVARAQGEYSVARTLYEECLGISRDLGDDQGIAWSLNDLGNVASRKGDNEQARSLYEESLAISRKLGDRRAIAWTLHHLGNIAALQGDYTVAGTLYAEGLAIFRALGDRQGVAWTLHHLGNVAGEQGDYDAAEALQQESLTTQRELENRVGIAWSLNSLGKVAYDRGDAVSARVLYEEGLGLFKELKDRRGVAKSLECLAAAMLMQGDAHKAACLWGAAEALRESMGLPLPRNEQDQYNRQLAQARSALGEGIFAAARAEGGRLSWEQAVDYATA